MNKFNSNILSLQQYYHLSLSDSITRLCVKSLLSLCCVKASDSPRRRPPSRWREDFFLLTCQSFRISRKELGNTRRHSWMFLKGLIYICIGYVDMDGYRCVTWWYRALSVYVTGVSCDKSGRKENDFQRNHKSVACTCFIPLKSVF